ncbi:LptF/LptG family permease [Aestuariibaculum sediminum]|uniref:LptF/LptG family permease n=1 Tax=Aestuariibaculum sediminum TaxID=2770637 RepID=A0A8J6QJ96_9FLAO|nr:LptF/LptG family permease [Aestuariibaculum sediminum]MBD0832779.1 LptF/LptG family permease [Aestuariibaculum sediminum]
MKILDRYILTSYLKTFLSVFIILMLIFVLQTIWLYIKELAGKDLDIEVIFKFLFYFMPKLIPLVLPLTILLASIMVFGSFAENYEFAAMKSTGISLQRAMSGLSVFIVILGITTFFFSNNVIPWAELKSYNLRRNIAKLKPAMVLAEGQFNPVGVYNIKFDKKHGERGQFLDNVTIHIKGSDGRKNATVIRSKTGELASREESNVIKLILNDGNYYSDIYSRDPKTRKKNPFAKSTFETYTINIDISQINDVDMDEESQTDKYSMLDVVDLNKSIDSLEKKRDNDHETFSKSMFQRTSIMANNHRITPTKKAPLQTPKKDSLNIVRTEHNLAPLLDSLDLRRQIDLVEMAKKTMGSARQLIISRETPIKASKSLINRHYISLHEKFALGLACIVLFFVGAPLGALIRKGGIGLPMVVAILLFLTYHFIGIFATNSAKNGGFNPILASWFSTLVMLPLGVFLTKRATADKGLFEFDNLIEPIKKALNIKQKESVDYTFLHSYKNDRLLDVIANYETLGHDENTRFEALKLLQKRGYPIPVLRGQGLSIDESFDTSEAIYKDYKDHTNFAITLYTIGAILLILHFIFANNKLPSAAAASIQLSIVSFVMYIIYYVKSILNISSFYKHINKVEKKLHIALLIIGLPLYFIGYVFLNSKMKEDLKQNCLNSLK